MKFDVMTGGLPLRSMAAFAQDAERAGFSGIVVTEGGELTRELNLSGG